MLEINHLQTQFKQGKRWVTAIDDINFTVHPGEIVGLVGESGCGKSVTSLSIMRLLNHNNSKISNGEVMLDDTNLLSLSNHEMNQIRGKDIAMVFQEPMSSLNPSMRIESQLIEAILLHTKVNRKQAHMQARMALESVGIPEPDVTLHSYPHQLSGGMCQRVMIAMAMSCQPKYLIADEPTTALDVTVQAQILRLMNEICEKNKTGILLITHDLGVVAQLCRRVVVMYAGRIVEMAGVKEIFLNPQHPYTRGLIASVPHLGRRVKRLPSIPGSVPNLDTMPQGCRFAPRCHFANKQCFTKEPNLNMITNAPGRWCRCSRRNEINCTLHEKQN